MTMSIADLLDDWFELPQVKAAMAINGVIGTWAGPCEPGTAYVMAHHSIGDVGDGKLGSWGYPEGGMGAVSDQIRASAVEAGATVRTDARVQKLLIKRGKVTGAVLSGGEEVHAPIVVSATHPQTLFLHQIDAGELPADFVADIRKWRSRSGVVKINLALAELPNFTADPGSNQQEHHTGSVEMAPSIEWIEEAFQEARQGRPATRPFSDSVIPTTFDKTLCPEGTHIMSLFTQWVPHDWSDAPHTEELEAYADRMIDCYAEFAPNIKGAILHRDVIGPYQMEQEYGLIGGNIFHGEISAEQLFHMRPSTRIRGLPDTDSRAVPGEFRDPRRWRRVRHPGPSGCARRPARPQERSLVSPYAVTGEHSAVAPALRAMLEARSVADRRRERAAGIVRGRAGASAPNRRFRRGDYPVNPRTSEIDGLACARVVRAGP